MDGGGTIKVFSQSTSNFILNLFLDCDAPWAPHGNAIIHSIKEATVLRASVSRFGWTCRHKGMPEACCRLYASNGDEVELEVLCGVREPWQAANE